MKLRGRKQFFCGRYLLWLLRRRGSTDLSVVNFVGEFNRPKWDMLTPTRVVVCSAGYVFFKAQLNGT